MCVCGIDFTVTYSFSSCLALGESVGPGGKRGSGFGLLFDLERCSRRYACGCITPYGWLVRGESVGPIMHQLWGRCQFFGFGFVFVYGYHVSMASFSWLLCFVFLYCYYNIHGCGYTGTPWSRSWFSCFVQLSHFDGLLQVTGWAREGKVSGSVYRWVRKDIRYVYALFFTFKKSALFRTQMD